MYFLLPRWRPKNIVVACLKSATTLDRTCCPWPLWMPGRSSLPLLLCRDVPRSTVLAVFGYATCSHLYFCIGFSTVGNAPEQFIFSNHSVQLLSPLGTERKSLTGRQLPVYKKPPWCQREISSWPTTVNTMKEEKQEKEGIRDKSAFRDSIWDNWLPANLPEGTTATGRLPYCNLYLTPKPLSLKVGFLAETSKLYTEL